MKRNVLIIGAGGVAHVAAHKCAQNNILLGDIHFSSRTLSKCQAIITSIKEKNSQCGPGCLQPHSLGALDVSATKALITCNGSQRVTSTGSERTSRRLYTCHLCTARMPIAAGHQKNT